MWSTDALTFETVEHGTRVTFHNITPHHTGYDPSTRCSTRPFSASHCERSTARGNTLTASRDATNPSSGPPKTIPSSEQLDDEASDVNVAEGPKYHVRTLDGLRQ